MLLLLQPPRAEHYVGGAREGGDVFSQPRISLRDNLITPKWIKAKLVQDFFNHI